MAIKESFKDRTYLPSTYLGKEPTEGDSYSGLGADGKGLQVQQAYCTR
jgi:hypothetical protein